MLEIKRTISCRELVDKQVKPVTATVLGELAGAETYKRSKPFYLDTEYLSVASKDYFDALLGQLTTQCEPTHLFEFRNASVVGQGAVILADGSLLHDSVAEFLNHAQKPEGLEGSLDKMWLEVRGDPLAGTTVLLKRPWYRNFGHFLVDLMPILPSLYAAGVDIDNILFGDIGPGPLQDIMVACAKFYYPGADLYFADDINPLNIKNLLYVQPVHVPPITKHPAALRHTRNAAFGIFAEGNGFDPAQRKLYISRQNASQRHIANHREMEDFLRSQGFFVFYPEDHSFGQQIAAFRQAEVIVGAKGAAFTNLLFCQPDCHALLFSASQFIDPFFWDVAAFSGVQYSEIFCMSEEGELPSKADLSVNLGKLKHFLSLI
ncbi:glycosyltransferase family 61 protein [Roseibium sp.]|uniref:glycosyltransferase family 61 protein n=1 Tax=Roseibium sp. TaxID=1936156 RepID=UPI003A976909